MFIKLSRFQLLYLMTMLELDKFCIGVPLDNLSMLSILSVQCRYFYFEMFCSEL